jgi:glycosyltransferase involved in cell wall biosynthesis
VNKKIAILFDFIEGSAGGEKLLRFLADRYKADIYTGYVNWDRTYPEFRNFNVKTIGKIPKIQLLKQEMLIRKFRKLKLSGYDAIICLGLYSIYAAEKNHPIIWNPYGVSPFFYKRADLPKGFVKRNIIWRIGAWLLTKRTKSYNKKIVKNNIDKIATISEYSRNAFNNYYERDSLVIPPPVDMKKHFYKINKGYYLLVARLEPGKRIELAIDAFKKMPDKTLFVEGIGSIKEKLEDSAKGYENIKLLGRVPSEKLPELYAECIALIGTAFFDDWSMPMVEALASGKPCIAVKQGAYVEIIDEKTGVLVNGDVDGIIKGVKKITPKVAEKMKDDCVERAKKWDTEIFGKKWDKLIEDAIKIK